MDFDTIHNIIKDMAGLVYQMLEETYNGFMKHDAGILSQVLKEEESLNEMDKKVNVLAAENARPGTIEPKGKEVLSNLIAMASDLEVIGDYIKDMVERIEIKVEEKLLFSQQALSEYQHLYEVVKTVLRQVVTAIKMDDYKFAQSLMCGSSHIAELVDKYHQTHTDRLLKGICSPLACNMFLNLLDSTAAIYNHSEKIAQRLQKIK